MAYKFLDPKIGLLDAPSVTGTTPLWNLGQKALAADASPLGTAAPPCVGEFVYCKGVASGGTAGALVQYAGYSASVMSAANSASRLPLGFAAGPLTATNVYGWVQVAGIVTNAYGTNEAFAAGIPLYLNATAGQVCSVTSLGNFLQGVHVYRSLASTQVNGSSASLQINYPMLAGLTASQ
jgi:hypothetical protein